MRRPPSRKGFRPGWERLEERIPLSLNIEFDDSYDSLGFFAENPAARTVLEEAAEIIGGQINDSLAAIAPDPAAGDTWTASFLDPTTGLERTVNNLSIPADTILIFVGGFAGQGSLGGQGGFGGYTVDGSPDWVDTVQTRGANSVIGIWGGAIRFNEDVDWSFAGTSGPPAANQVDFLTMAEHEIGRVLGLGTSPGWQAWVDGANDTFTGPHAEATYGGPVPLNPAGQFGDPADGLWAATVTSYGQAPTMDVTPLDPGVRRLFTSLDWAALDDIGWDTDHLVVTAQPPANVEGSEVFGISVAAESTGWARGYDLRRPRGPLHGRGWLARGDHGGRLGRCRHFHGARGRSTRRGRHHRSLRRWRLVDRDDDPVRRGRRVLRTTDHRRADHLRRRG